MKKLMIDLKKFNRVLTFFSHPDDETLAAGATLVKLIKIGANVHVAIPATGVHSRRNIKDKKQNDIDLIELRTDCEKAMSVLGIPTKNIHLGNFPDNELDKHTRLELIHWLEEIIKLVKPDLILTHHRYCTNIDHQYCHEAVVVATRPNLNNHITVLCGEVPSSTGYLKPTAWEPNLYVEVSEDEIDTKILAMETFKGEARAYPHPRSKEVIKALAMVRGSESGFYYSESFMVQKMFG